MNPFNKPELYEGNEPYIFISYSHKNKNQIYEILWKLNARGVRYWYDDGIEKGKNWKSVVKQKLEDSASVWFFIDDNFFISDSIREEIAIVHEMKKDYVPVYFNGGNFNVYFGSALKNNASIDSKTIVMYCTMFNMSIVGIVKNDSQDEFIDEMVIDAHKHSSVNSEIKLPEKRIATKSVVFIGKNSYFTKAIVDGVNRVFSTNGYVELKYEFISGDNALSQSFQFIEVLKKCLGKYNGFIIRPLGTMDNETFDIFKQICRTSKVILCDVDISAKQREELGDYAPTYVCSDFQIGGEKIGEFINILGSIYGNENINILICNGPKTNMPANIRSMAILKNISSNYLDKCRYVELHSLQVKDSFARISKLLQKECRGRLSDKCLIIYAGNDNVALYLAKNIDTIRTETGLINEYEKIIIIGYDGIKGITGNSILEEARFDYATVDTIPQKQGEIIATNILGLLNGNCGEKIVMVKPKLIKNVSFIPMNEAKFEAVLPLLERAKLFIFDLDGTIADTETLHWEAYNQLLQEKYGIELKNEDIKRYIGNNEISIYRMIERDYNISINTEEFLEERINVYLQLVRLRNLRPFNWVNDFCEQYIDSGIPVMLLTSQVPEVVDNLLSYWNLDSLIPKEMRISAHNGKITKSEVFANPNKYIGISEEFTDSEVVVFEDSDNVAKLAFDNGYTVIGIKHKYNKQSLKHCHATIDQDMKKGLFVGLGGIDIVYNLNSLPEENNKVKSEKYHVRVGGPALNAALTCARLGGNATLITGIGRNSIGKIITDECQRLGVRVIDISSERELPNISCIGLLRCNASRTIISGQKPNADYKAPTNSFFNKFDYCLYDCNLPQYTQELVETLQDCHIPLVLDCGAWKDNIRCALDYADIAITSSGFVDEFGNDIFKLKEQFRIKYIAKTRGSKSIQYALPYEYGEIAVSEKKHVDTLGAGDVLHGAFCYYFYDCGLGFKDALERAAEIATDFVKQI